MCLGSFASFETIEEVIARANNSLYGLAAGVWSSNINTCMTTSPPLCLCLCLCLSVCLSTSLCVPAWLPACLSACLPVSFSLSLSLCLSHTNVGRRRYDRRGKYRRWNSLGERHDELLGLPGLPFSRLSLSLYLSFHLCVCVLLSYTTIGYQAPFGGPKQTGGGRTNGKQGLDEYLITKTVSINLNN